MCTAIDEVFSKHFNKRKMMHWQLSHFCNISEAFYPHTVTNIIKILSLPLQKKQDPGQFCSMYVLFVSHSPSIAFTVHPPGSLSKHPKSTSRTIFNCFC